MSKALKWEIVELLGCLAQAEGDKTKAERLARKRLPIMHTRAAVGGTEHSDLAGSFDNVLGGLFIPYMENGPGLYENLRKRSRRLKNPKDRMIIPSAAVSGSATDESAGTALTKFALDASGMPLVKAVGMGVASNESLADPEVLEWILGQMSETLTLSSDTKLVAILKAACSSPITATNGALVDFKSGNDDVFLTGFADPVNYVSPVMANYLATLTGTGGNLIFPDMSPQGGMVLGVPTLVSAAMADDEILIVDCKGLVTADYDLTFKTSENTLIEMDDAPAMDSQAPTTASGAVVSMFQVDATAFLANRTFGCKVLRPSAVQLLSSISW